jgi:hypothetical protein
MNNTLIIILAIVFCACSGKEVAITIEPMPSPAGAGSGEPYLFSDQSGQVFMSWIEHPDSVNFLKMAQWNAEGWTTPDTIMSGTDWFVNWADYPQVVSGGDGKFIAHTLMKSGDDTFAYDVKIATCMDGGSWTPPVTLHDDGKQAEHGFVSMTPYKENAFISWLDGRNTVNDNPTEHDGHGHHGEMTVRAAVVGYDGKKLSEWELDKRVCDCCQTTAAITDNGPVVIYRDRSENEIRDISIVRFVNGQWTTPQPVYQDDWEINGCPVNGPRCEAIGNTLVIAWFTMAGDTPAVNVVFSSDGGASFGTPIRVAHGNTIGRVDVVLLDEERALISWMEGSNIMVTTVSEKGTMSAPTLVASSSESRSSGFPQLTKCAGGVMMAWTDAEAKTVKTAKLRL